MTPPDGATGCRASVKSVTRIIDTAESESVRLADGPSPTAGIARVRLRMLDDLAREHGAAPSPDALFRMVESFASGVPTRTLTESLARWLPLVGRMVDALAQARATHEIGWAAHAHFAALDERALAALAEDGPPGDDFGAPGSGAGRAGASHGGDIASDASIVTGDSGSRFLSSNPAPKIPPAMLADGTPNPDLVSYYAGGTWVAVEELERRIAEDPANDELIALLAFMYYSSNQLGRAIEAYGRALSLNDRNVTAHYYLGNAHFKRGEYELARQAWERTVELDPDGRMASNARRRTVAILKLSGDPASR